MGFIEEFKRAYTGDDTQHYASGWETGAVPPLRGK